MAHVLDLEVSPCSEYQIAVLVIVCHVAGAVQQARVLLDIRILEESLLCLFRVVPVTESKSGSAYADLANIARLRDSLLSLLVEEHYFGVHESLAYRQCLEFVLLAFNYAVCAVAGDLCWSVEIDIHRIRQIVHPVVERLNRHYLSGEHYVSHVWLFFYSAECLEVRNYSECRYSPDDGVCLVLDKELQQQLRHEEQPLRHNDYGSAVLHGVIDILDRYVEVERSLVSVHHSIVKSEGLSERLYHVDDSAVAYNYSLRHTGRTRCEDSVDRVSVDCFASHFFEKLLIYFSTG